MTVTAGAASQQPEEGHALGWRAGPRREGSAAIRWFEVALRAGTAYGRDRCTIFAAGITYFALISLFPLALFAVGVLAFFVTDVGDQQRLIDELMETLPLTEEDGRGDLEQVVDSVVSARGALGVIGFVGTAYAASALFTSVRVALNGVFHVERQRPFVLGKTIDLALVVGFGLLLLASFALTVAIAFAQRQTDALVGDNLATLTAWLASLAYLLIPPLVTGLVFLLLYTSVARAGYTARQVLPGVILAALLFELLKIGFAQYVASFGNYDATYGALGFVIVLLLFFNFSAQVMLFGAEVARANVEVRVLERSGGGFPTVANVLERTRAALDRGRAIPVLGRGLPWLPEPRRTPAARDVARAWISPEEAPPATAPEAVPAVPDHRAPETRGERRTATPQAPAELSSGTATSPTGSFALWALLTGLGVAITVWLGDHRR